MDTAQWPQGIGLVKPMEELVGGTSTSTSTAIVAGGPRGQPQVVERRARPQREQSLNCPRCNSTNTKFCYYNNYSLTQPRYFCKTCRRYWTEGGSLRNVPVGGGSRKNKRSSSSSSNTATGATTSTGLTPSSSCTTASSLRKLPSDLNPPSISLSASQNPKFHEGQDLNLAYPLSSAMPDFGDLSNMDSSNNNSNSNNPGHGTGLSAMDLLRSGISGRGLGPFIQMPMAMPEGGAVYPHGFGLHEFRPPTLNFPLDGVNNGDHRVGGGHHDQYVGMQGVQQGGAGRMLFPFEDLRQVSPGGTAGDHQFDQQNRSQGGGDPPGFWNNMMGGAGGGSW